MPIHLPGGKPGSGRQAATADAELVMAYLRTVIHASAATSALAYGAYATAATVGRLIADRLASRIGPVALFRSGATLAGLGMVTAVLSHQTALAIAAWAAVGLGLSGCIPQLSTAAGRLDRDAAGANVARVAGLGYLDMLAGPAIIGPLTRLIALEVLPMAPCFAAAYAAGVLRPARQPAERPAANQSPQTGHVRAPRYDPGPRPGRVKAPPNVGPILAARRPLQRLARDVSATPTAKLRC